jgi:hypothetical protein
MLIPNDPLGRTYAMAVVDAAIGHAIAGKCAYLSELLDRTEGRVALGAISAALIRNLVP